MVREIAESAPIMNGVTTAKSSEPATLEMGLEVLTPDCITESGEFLGRA